MVLERFTLVLSTAAVGKKNKNCRLLRAFFFKTACRPSSIGAVSMLAGRDVKINIYEQGILNGAGR